MLVGYARVAPRTKGIEQQVEALTMAGCDRVFADYALGEGPQQVEFEAAMAALRSGDTFMVWRLDRLACPIRGVVRLVTSLEAQGVHFASLVEGIDTSAKFTFSGFAAFLAEMERNLVGEKTRVGLAAAISRGKQTGRPPKLTAQQLAHARRLLADPETTGSEVAKSFGVARSTLYRALSRAGLSGIPDGVTSVPR